MHINISERDIYGVEEMRIESGRTDGVVYLSRAENLRTSADSFNDFRSVCASGSKR